MIKKIFLLCLLSSLIVSSSYAKTKNLYILIEPTSALSIEDASKHILMPSLMMLDNIIKWIGESESRPKFNNVYIRVIGYGTQLYKRREIDLIAKQSVVENIYNNLKNKKEYSVSNGLSHFAQDLEGFTWKGEETMLLIIGDLNFVKSGISSHGKYLNSAWLNHESSPFVRDFIKRDNTIAENTSVVVFTRTQLKLKEEKYRNDFIVNLFTEVGMKVYYVGDFYNNFMANLKDKDTFSIKLIDRIRRGKHEAMKSKAILETNRCQVIGDETMTIKNCGK